MITISIPGGGGAANAVEAIPAVSAAYEVTKLTINSVPSAGDAVRLWALSAGQHTSYWFSVGGSGSNPDVSGGAVEVALGASPSVGDVQTALAAAINGAGELYGAASGSNEVLVTEPTAGPGQVIDITLYSPTISSTVVTAGVTAAPRKIESIDGSDVTGVDADMLEGSSLASVLSQADSLATNIANTQRGFAVVASATAANSSQVLFENVFAANTTFDDFMIVVDNLAPQTDIVGLRVMLRSGGADLTNTYRWGFTFVPMTSGAAGNTVNQTGTAGWQPFGASMGNAVDEINTLVMQVFPRVSGRVHALWHALHTNNSTQAWSFAGGGRYEQSINPSGIRFLMTTGNIATGRFTVLGRKKS